MNTMDGREPEKEADLMTSKSKTTSCRLWRLTISPSLMKLFQDMPQPHPSIPFLPLNDAHGIHVFHVAGIDGDLHAPLSNVLNPEQTHRVSAQVPLQRSALVLGVTVKENIPSAVEYTPDERQSQIPIWNH